MLKVPSYRRVSDMNSDQVHEELVEGELGGNDGSWCAPHVLTVSEESEIYNILLIIYSFF